MKKIIVLLVIMVLGVGTYFGYYGMQRTKINMRLNGLLATCDPETADDSALQELRENICMAVEEENEQFKQAAAASKTYQEFEDKVQALISQSLDESKTEQLIKQYKLRKEQHEQEE